MYLSTPTPSVLLQKPVKIFSQESVWKGEWDRFHSSLQGWSVAGEYDDHYYRIITTRSHDGTFTPAEEMAEVIMRFGKVTRLLAMIAPAWKTQWPVAVLYACGLIGMQLCRFSGLHFPSFSTTQRQKQAEKCSILSLRTADGRVGSRLLFHLHVRLLHYLGLRFVLYLNVAVAECKRRLRVPGGILFAIHYTWWCKVQWGRNDEQNSAIKMVIEHIYPLRNSEFTCHTPYLKVRVKD